MSHKGSDHQPTPKKSTTKQQQFIIKTIIITKTYTIYSISCISRCRIRKKQPTTSFLLLFFLQKIYFVKFLTPNMLQYCKRKSLNMLFLKVTFWVQPCKTTKISKRLLEEKNTKCCKMMHVIPPLPGHRGHFKQYVAYF